MAHDSKEDRPGHEPERAEELAHVEAALRGLAPRPARLSAARLLYLAGRESAENSRRTWAAWFWPSLAAASTLAASVLATLLAVQPAPQIVERVVYIERPAGNEGEEKLVQTLLPPVSPNAVPDTLPDGKIPTPHYLRARELATSQGVDSLPTFEPGTANVEVRPATYREMQNRAIEGEYGGRRKLPDAGFFSWSTFLLRGDVR